MNKFSYSRVIQQGHGQGWEDVSHYETNSSFSKLELNDKPNPKTGRKESLLSHDLREYRTMGYSTRVVNRRELNELYILH
jgi:hypothetical protein